MSGYQSIQFPHINRTIAVFHEGSPDGCNTVDLSELMGELLDHITVELLLLPVPLSGGEPLHLDREEY